MTKKPYDFLVFIGRFQPFHLGHYKVISQGLEMAENIIVVVGSHDSARTIRNPLTSDERIHIIRQSLSSEEKKRVHCVKQMDYLYNEDKWISSLQASVYSIIHQKWRAGPYKIGILGYDKDHSSYYLKKFPTWEHVAAEKVGCFNATDIRTNIFSNVPQQGDKLPLWAINETHRELVNRFFDDLSEIQEEYHFLARYRSQWQNSPYSVTFNTVDTVVTQSAHVLVVRRKSHPGKGLIALPGGFLNDMETIREAQLRELYEETRIDVPKPVLNGCIVKAEVFDHPDRSQRGRTITHCVHIRLPEQEKLPKIKGSSDADKAWWMPLAEFPNHRSEFFEDHFDIISAMLGI